MSLNASPTLEEALLAQGVKLPLHVSDAECGVVLDADGRDVLTVDSNGFQPDDQVNAIAALIAACVNQSPGVLLSAADGDETTCPICAVSLKGDDICATDIELGICHAKCLEGSPVVDLETGDEIPDGRVDTYRFGSEGSDNG